MYSHRIDFSRIVQPLIENCKLLHTWHEKIPLGQTDICSKRINAVSDFDCLYRGRPLCWAGKIPTVARRILLGFEPSVPARERAGLAVAEVTERSNGAVSKMLGPVTGDQGF